MRRRHPPALRPPVRRLALPAAALTLALAGCTPPPPRPAPRPELPAATPAPVPARSPDSAAMAAYYAQLQQKMLDRGLLRTDRGGPDAPYDARILARNFMRVALYDEYAPEGAAQDMVAQQTPDHLRRWDKPVRMRMEFGATVPEAERRTDLDTVAALDARLAGLTGLSITVAEGDGTTAEGADFHVLVVNEDERRALGPRLRQLVPGIGENVVRTITDMPRSTYCLVFAFNRPGDYTYSQAVAVIRAEHPPLMRRACYEEELSQGLGPANDSPEARPSIFNDDQEYALLTTQDALILRMLYDPRLTPGMTPDEARPIVDRLAREYLGGRS